MTLPRVIVQTEPSAEPVTLTELKTHLRQSDSSQDINLTALISAARRIAERITGRSIPTQTLELSLDSVPLGGEDWWDGVREGDLSLLTGGRPQAIDLPRGPVTSITSAKFYQDDDSSTTMDPANYRLSNSSPDQPARLVLKRGAVWPVALRTSDAVVIRYVAGYATCPWDLHRAILMMAAWMFENGGDCGDEECAGACGQAMILDLYKLKEV